MGRQPSTSLQSITLPWLCANPPSLPWLLTVNLGPWLGFPDLLCLPLPVFSSFCSALKSELRTVAELYGKERGTNASLLSKIRALKGNIEVGDVTGLQMSL